MQNLPAVGCWAGAKYSPAQGYSAPHLVLHHSTDASYFKLLMFSCFVLVWFGLVWFGLVLVFVFFTF